ncbi:hypothetical protein SANBI_002269 [Sanguibacter sp. 4.1]|uniref:Uncharacterized protein n=1 Tax=Sanguibacter biliveldensis TaxID=3030830 RepID=A0AAF0Z0W4_9MICO|nr:hypothetical protein [Sanguibacter sp. 4.1]WPF81010.1 hypothetical protein SANBI_002269 [Sanguibacter sp. 4.1]
MHAILARLTLSPVLLPGASGRTDVSAQTRAVVVARITSLLEEAGLSGRGSGTEDDHPHVLVVAPARRPMIAVDARPDLGALGLETPSAPGGSGSGVGGGSPALDVGPTLDVTATVAVTLLRLAGWHGAVETVEVAGSADDGADGALDALDSLEAVVSTRLPRRQLVLLATGSDEAQLPAGARPALAAAHTRVRSLGDRLSITRVSTDALVD